MHDQAQVLAKVLKSATPLGRQGILESLWDFHIRHYSLPQLKEAGGHFVNSVIRTGKDTAAIVKFEGEATLMQGLTSNTARLRKGLEEIAYIGAPAEPVERVTGVTVPSNSSATKAFVPSGVMATPSGPEPTVIGALYGG